MGSCARENLLKGNFNDSFCRLTIWTVLQVPHLLLSTRLVARQMGRLKLAAKDNGEEAFAVLDKTCYARFHPQGTRLNKVWGEGILCISSLESLEYSEFRFMSRRYFRSPAISSS